MSKVAYRKPLAELVEFEDSDIICASAMGDKDDPVWSACASSDVFVDGDNFVCKLSNFE